MRIDDGGICSDCSYFEHDCWEEGCGENCNCDNKEIKEIFYEFDEVIKECKCFKEW